MCGIAGFVNREGIAADRETVERMTRTLAHRGPDGDGFFIDGPVALGHRRLAIIDVEKGANRFRTKTERFGSLITAKFITNWPCEKRCRARACL